MFKGLILKESLLSKKVFDLLNIDKTENWENIEGTIEGQPNNWTAVFVSVDPGKIQEVLEILKQDLISKPIGWYANFSNKNEEDSFIVFPKKVFNVAKEGKKEAIEYGLSLGIPMSQLDF